MTSGSVTHRIADLKEQLKKRWSALATREVMHIFPLLAKRSPVSISSLQKKSKLELTELKRRLERAPLNWNEKNEIVGVFGYTLNRNDHELIFNEVTTYCCCGLWAHFIPRFVDQNAVVRTLDPLTQKEVILKIAPTGLKEYLPTTAVGVLVDSLPDSGQGSISEKFCNHIRLFESGHSANEWAKTSSNRFVVSLEVFDDIATELHSNFWTSGKMS